MRLCSLFALVGLAAAEASIYERQVMTIVNVVNQISTDTQALDTTVKSFNGAADVQKLQAASDKVSQTVTSSVQTVMGASSISLTDALTIQGQVQNMQSTIETTVNDLISKKSAIVSAGAGAQVSASLNQQLQGAQQLITAISSKVPPEVASLAQQLSTGVTGALQKGVDAFKGTGGATSASRSGAAVSATASRKPATFTGAATPKAVAGSLAGLAGFVALVL
jgi:exonuclease VII small subunit